MFRLIGPNERFGPGPVPDRLTPSFVIQQPSGPLRVQTQGWDKRWASSSTLCTERLGVKGTSISPSRLRETNYHKSTTTLLHGKSFREGFELSLYVYEKYLGHITFPSPNVKVSRSPTFVETLPIYWLRFWSRVISTSTIFKGRKWEVVTYEPDSLYWVVSLETRRSRTRGPGRTIVLRGNFSVS